MSKIFTDYKHYPHGFARSGDYTIKETERLEKFGCLFKDLLSGAKAPATDEEKSFLKQLTGKAEATSLEVLAWNKYQKKISTPTKYFPLCSTTREKEASGEAAKVVGDDVDVDVDVDIDADVETETEDDADEAEIEE